MIPIAWSMIMSNVGGPILQLSDLSLWLLMVSLGGILIGVYLLQTYSQSANPRRTDRLWGIILIGVCVALLGSFLPANMLWEIIVPLVGLLSFIVGAGKLLWNTIDRLVRKSDRQLRDFGAGLALLIIGLAHIVWFLGALGDAFR